MRKLSVKTILITVIPVVISGCNNPDTKNPPTEKAEGNAAPVEVQTTPVETGTFEREILSNGQLQPLHKATLSFERSGVLNELNITNGQSVQKGDTLAVLDTQHASLKLEKARIKVKKARTELLDLLITQQGDKLADTARLSQQKKNHLLIKSGLSAARTRLKEARLNYRNCFVTAPFTGRVANVELNNHNRVKSGEKLCMLIDDRKWLIEFSLLESEVNSVDLGQQIEVMPLEQESRTLEGKVTAINPVVDKNGLVTLHALLRARRSWLMDGRHVKVRVIHKIPDQLLVPRKAIVLRSNREVVFVYKNGQAKWVYVDVVGENSQRVAVEGKLEATDKVIVSNNMNLAHDAEVTLEGEEEE